MRKFLIFTLSLMALVLPSCTPKFSTAFYYTDFSQYLEKGFFITESNTVPFNYDPVGSLYIRQKAGKMVEVKVEAQNVKEEVDFTEIYGFWKKKEKKTSAVVKPSEASALDAAFDFAKEHNADGIINISFDYFTENGSRGVILRGMLIKRN